MMRVAMGPKLPGIGSWDWIGADLSKALQRDCDVVCFDDRVPDCDVAVIIKYFPEREELVALADRVPVVFCPVDRYGRGAEIDRQAAFLQRCAGIVVHAESLRKYFASYAPVDYLDHHVKYIAEMPATRRTDGPILWVGVRNNVPALVAWCRDHQLPAPLLVLTNPANPRQVPAPAAFGFPSACDVQLEVWSPERHRAALLESRAAIDIKGDDFRSRHKPPSKAIDFLASGLPLAVNAGHCSIKDLQQHGFQLANVAGTEDWLSEDYWQKTQAFGAKLHDQLSCERIATELKTILQNAVERRASKTTNDRSQISVPSLLPFTVTHDNNRPTRVALVSFLFNWPSTGGGIMHTVELAAFLRQAGYDVRLFAPRFEPWRIGHVSADCPFPVHSVPFSPAEWRLPDVLQRLRNAVDEFDPDSVIITDAWNIKPHLFETLKHYRVLLRMQALECLCPLNNLRLLPTVSGLKLCPHHQLTDPDACRSCLIKNEATSGSLHRLEREFCAVGSDVYHERLQSAFQSAHAVLVLNPVIADLLRPHCGRVETVTWGMNAERFPTPEHNDRRLSDTDGRMRLLFAGLTTESIKGSHVLREACRRLWQHRQDFELVLTDEGRSDREPFERYVGWQSQHELPRWYRQTDITVVPTVAPDGLSRTSVEAMASSRPVVASRIGGLPFTVTDGETGLLFTPGDADDLAAKLNRLLDDRELRTRMGAAGRRDFERRFTWPQVIERCYVPLLGPPTRSPILIKA